MQAARPDVILHAGDIILPAVIAELEKIAPVEVARGNRDWAFPKAKWVNQVELAGVRVALMHGHIGLLHYLADKFAYMAQGYRFERYRPYLLRASQGARVVVFGHTHHIENTWVEGQLLFNPGSAGLGFLNLYPPSWGLLSFFSDGNIMGEVFEMKGYRIVKGEWLRISLENS